MSSDIATILRRFESIGESASQISEAKSVTPAAPKLPALFKPAKISPVIGAKEKQHPTHRYFVGDDVQIDVAQTPLEERIKDVEEGMINKVRRDLTTYLDALAAEQQAQKELVDKAKQDVEDINPAKPGQQSYHEDDNTITTPECAPTPISRIALEDGSSCDIYGNDNEGFEIRRGNKRLPTRFKNADDAATAVELWKGHRAQQQKNNNQDYVEER